jgi:hypothetical protein
MARSFSFALGFVSLAGLAPLAHAAGTAIDLSTLPAPTGITRDVPIFVTNEGLVSGIRYVDLPSGQTTSVAWRSSKNQPAQQLGLFGGSYGSANDMRLDAAYTANAAGLVAGVSRSTLGSFDVLDSWLFDGAQAIPIGPRPESLVTPGVARYVNNPLRMNSAGQTLGFTYIERSSGGFSALGWIAQTDGTTTTLALPGSEFVDPATSLPVVAVYDINSAGAAIASAQRFASGGGEVAFVSEAGSVRELGFATGPYVASSGRRISTPVDIADSGLIIGNSQLLAPGFGTGVWIDRGQGPIEVGITRPEARRPNGNTFQFMISVAGENDTAVGYARLVGVAPGNNENKPGVVFAVQGGQTTELALTDNARYTGEGGLISSAFVLQAPDGTVLGTSNWAQRGDSNGRSAWVFDPARTPTGAVRVGLQGPRYTGADGRMDSFPTAARSGLVAGISRVYVGDDNYWNDAFITDLATNQTTALVFSQRSDGAARTAPLALTPEGGVFGNYTRFVNNVPESERLFFWSASLGFIDLLPPDLPALQFGDVPAFAISPDGRTIAIAATLATPGSDASSVMLRVALPQGSVCDSIDFNNDGLFPSDDDLVAFLSVLAGGSCGASTATCNDIDFNNDGLFPSDDDLLAYLRVLAGGNC